MISAVRLSVTTTYRVEVSGWDIQHNFFVAKANLEWTEDNGKKLTILRRLSDRAILFVGLVPATNPNRALSVPYEAEEIGVTPDGQYQFRLYPLQPRRGMGTSS